MVGLLIGLIFSVLVLISGWLKFILLFISRGLIGSWIPLLYFILPITTFTNNNFQLSLMNFLGFVPGLIIIGYITIKGTDNEIKTGVTNTVSICGSGMLLGSIFGMLIKFFFN
jgi:hypothetical protein